MNDNNLLRGNKFRFGFRFSIELAALYFFIYIYHLLVGVQQTFVKCEQDKVYDGYHINHSKVAHPDLEINNCIIERVANMNFLRLLSKLHY